MKNILVSGIGGDLGQSIANVIRNTFPNFNIFGTDLNNQNSGKLFCEELFLIPNAKSDLYISSINKIINSRNIDLFIPSTEQELEKISLLKNNEIINTKVLGYFKEIWTIGRDKLYTSQWLNSLKIGSPETFLLTQLNISEIEALIQKHRKLILKKRIGSGSKSVFEISNLSSISENIFLNSNDWIIQEYIPNEFGEITIAVNNLNNFSNHIQLKRVLSAGSTNFAEVIYNKEISIIVNKIISELKEECAFNIQLRFIDKKPMIFEINPRFSSTVFARHNLGFPDLSQWISHSLKLNKKYNYNYKIGSKFYRFYSYTTELKN